MPNLAKPIRAHRGEPIHWRIGPPAMLASFAAHESFMGRSGNRIPDTRVVLHLVDVEWASRQPH